MIIDAHLHLWKKIDGRVDGRTVRGDCNGVIRIGSKKMLGMPATHLDCSAPAELALAEFDAAGVDAGVVVQEPLDGPQNIYLRSVIAKYPQRFAAMALPDFCRADRVAAEARQLLSRGFAGIKLPANRLIRSRIELNSPAFDAIWEQLESEQKVLAVDLCEGQSQVAAMEDILRRFPKLPVALGHFGMVNRGGWPGQLKLCRHKNVQMETGGIVWLFRDEGFPFHGAIAAIRKAIREVGAEKLMWGSDWPRTMVDFTYRQSLDFIRASKLLSSSEKKLILAENAARLYRIKKSKSRRAVPLITEG